MKCCRPSINLKVHQSFTVLHDIAAGYTLHGIMHYTSFDGRHPACTISRGLHLTGIYIYIYMAPFLVRIHCWVARRLL